MLLHPRIRLICEVQFLFNAGKKGGRGDRIGSPMRGMIESYEKDDCVL